MKDEELERLKQEEVRLWWERWWKEDFSWDGLKRKQWRGWKCHPNGMECKPAGEAPEEWRPASLQDYWRLNTGAATELLTLDGKQFTPLHFPLHDKAGNKTDKEDWGSARLGQNTIVVSGLVTKAKSSFGSYSRIDGPDHRAQLDGIVVLIVPRVPIQPGTHANLEFGPEQPINISARRAYLPIEDRWKTARFGPLTDFEGALLPGETQFAGAAFQHAIYFPGTVFLGGANFGGARFVGGSAQFGAARFIGGVTFAKVEFGHDCAFRETMFFGPAHFFEIKFEGNAHFDAAHFSGDAVFRASVFFGIADFKGAFFKSPEPYASTIVFMRTEFKAFATFAGATFTGNVTFSNANFSEQADLSGLHAGAVRDIDFMSATFAAPSKFSIVGRHSRGVWDKAFVDAKISSFFDTAKELCFSQFAAFDGALITGRVDFSDASFRNDSGFKMALSRARGFKRPSNLREMTLRTAAALRRSKTLRRGMRIIQNDARREARNRRLRALEGGCRAIKQSAENRRDRLQEQRFYTYELIARRNHSETPPWERVVSLLFDSVSTYGSSVSRPIRWLLGLWIVFAAMYWTGAAVLNGSVLDLLTYAPGEVLDPSVWQALKFSAKSIFTPFAVWGRLFEQAGAVEHDLLVGAGDMWGLVVRLASTLQSFGAIALIFLIALAIRRRFQIN